MLKELSSIPGYRIDFKGFIAMGLWGFSRFGCQKLKGKRVS